MNDLLDFVGIEIGLGKRNVDLKKELEKANKNKISERIPQTVSELAKAKDITQEGALNLMNFLNLDHQQQDMRQELSHHLIFYD